MTQAKPKSEMTPEEREEIRRRRREEKRQAMDQARDTELERERAREKQAGSNVSRMRGRPSEYSEQEADAICAWIAEGRSMASYCRERGRDAQTIYRWLREHGDFHARYARAHDDRADALADQIQDIADEQVGASDRVAVEAAKLRIEARKWIASKLRPQKWGDKVEVNQKGSVTFNIGIGRRTQLIEGDATAVDGREQSTPLLAEEEEVSPKLLIKQAQSQD